MQLCRWWVLMVCAGATGCSMQRPTVPRVPAAPDYRASGNWAALPGRADAADFVPRRAPEEVLGPEDSLGIDVFFVHPTIYERGRMWNADVADRRMNRQVDKLPIRLQASAFGTGTRLYAPRYRQAHLGVFTWKDAASDRALDTAYADVRAAFELYLREWNGGRAFILAGHSQGSWHLRTLLQEFFPPGSPLLDQLVAVYMPGFDFFPDQIPGLPPCSAPDDTRCWCAWMTYGVEVLDRGPEAFGTWNTRPPACINPVTWRADTVPSPATSHRGVVLASGLYAFPGALTARVDRGVVLVDLSPMPADRLFRRENWHAGDINLFWAEIRRNVRVRAAAFER